MPHQCLSCGHTFEEGSAALLQGCPSCKGTRFFYTNQPVGDEERKRLQSKAQRDIREVVTELLQESAPEAAAALQAKADADGWAAITPRDLRGLVKQVQKETADKPAPQAAAAASRRTGKPAPGAADREERPDTVTIRGAGEYEIDVKGLLERNPIVVQKDGAYLIHLPSLFGRKT